MDEMKNYPVQAGRAALQYKESLEKPEISGHLISLPTNNLVEVVTFRNGTQFAALYQNVEKSVYFGGTEDRFVFLSQVDLNRSNPNFEDMIESLLVENEETFYRQICRDFDETDYIESRQEFHFARVARLNFGSDILASVQRFLRLNNMIFQFASIRFGPYMVNGHGFKHFGCDVYNGGQVIFAGSLPLILPKGTLHLVRLPNLVFFKDVSCEGGQKNG